MTIPNLSALIQRLLADDGLRQTFLDSPDLVLSDKAFSAEELRALLKLRTRLSTADGPNHFSIGPEARWP